MVAVGVLLTLSLCFSLLNLALLIPITKMLVDVLRIARGNEDRRPPQKEEASLMDLRETVPWPHNMIPPQNTDLEGLDDV